jgi:hypothetical protein
MLSCTAGGLGVTELTPCLLPGVTVHWAANPIYSIFGTTAAPCVRFILLPTLFNFVFFQATSYILFFQSVNCPNQSRRIYTLDLNRRKPQITNKLSTCTTSILRSLSWAHLNLVRAASGHTMQPALSFSVVLTATVASPVGRGAATTSGGEPPLVHNDASQATTKSLLAYRRGGFRVGVRGFVGAS